METWRKNDLNLLLITAIKENAVIYPKWDYLKYPAVNLYEDKYISKQYNR